MFKFSKQIARTDIGTHMISTIKVNGYYETAIWILPEHAEGNIVVVAQYDNKKDALEGHKEQVENCERMRPKMLWDINEKKNIELK